MLSYLHRSMLWRSVTNLLWLGAISTIFGAAQMRVSEFSAAGRQGVLDEDGDTPDWIEIQNISAETVNLAGWKISDGPAEKKFWSFPSTNLPAAGFMVIFASDKDRAISGAPLHTNFKLNAEGGDILLKSPSGEISGIEEYPPQVPGIPFGIATVEQTSIYTYLANSTPGASNAPARANATGPRIQWLKREPLHPQKSGEPINITAKVTTALPEKWKVTLRYRVNFARELTLPMHDDGQHHDGAANDGIFGAAIPAGVAKPGEIVRYFITAEDSAGRTSRWPLTPNRPGYSAYEGTIIPVSLETRLPVYHLFTPPRSSLGNAPTHAVLVHAGEFYDNVMVSPHGQISAEFPKPSFNLDFPHDHRFRYKTNAPRVSDLKILGNFADKSKIRNTLSYEMIEASGSIGHFAFPIRVQHNGEFFCVAEVVEDGDDRWLTRVGLDPQGALYKMYSPLPFTRTAEKKTRKQEGSRDLAAFAAALAEDRPLPDRVAYVLDHVNLPQCISYLVAMSLINSGDQGHKNYYLYRDTRGSGEWSLLPWDVDLSWGRTWTKTYFDDQLYFDTPLTLYRAGAQNRGRHPLYNVIFEHPPFRQMYLRRLRTVLDELLGTDAQKPSRIEARIAELLDLIDPAGFGNSDADLDTHRWPAWPPRRTARAEAQRMVSEYLPARRDFLLRRATLYGDRLPDAQPREVTVKISEVQRGSIAEQFVRLENTNQTAVDISGWKLSGAGIEYTFPSGSVVPAKATMEIVADIRAVRSTENFKAGTRLLQGNFQGSLSAEGQPRLTRK